MKSKDYTNHIVGGAVLIILILVGVYLVVNKRVPALSIGNSAEEGSSANENTANMSVTLAVAAQAAGSEVKVTGLSVTNESWVAVRDADGLRVLGAARVSPGASTITVPLLRATVAGKSYQAVIFADDGDRAFDMKKDVLVDGVSAAFSAQ